MTEAEALDEAARAYGWDNFADAAFFYGPDCTSAPQQIAGFRAHAKTIMENAALKAEIERLTAILAELNDTDIVARTMAENERLRNAMVVMDNTVRELEAARTQGWNEAIEAAARVAATYDDNSPYRSRAEAIRALTKDSTHD